VVHSYAPLAVIDKGVVVADLRLKIKEDLIEPVQP
jgi:hypothetical protein